MSCVDAVAPTGIADLPLSAPGVRMPAPDIGAYPCPCCGHLTLPGPPGSYEICPVCFWEDDLAQLRWAGSEVGPNRISLVDAQLMFQATGASKERSLPYVRPAAPNEPRDVDWRPIDPASDSFECEYGPDAAPWPDDVTVLYYWRDTFWRRNL